MPRPSGPGVTAPLRDDEAVVLIDGVTTVVCNMCNSFAHFVLKRDVNERFHFASLQSPAAERLLSHYHMEAYAHELSSVVLLEQERASVKSDAILCIMSSLAFPWSLARFALYIPRPLRDAVYTLVTRMRYHLFGKRSQEDEVCRVDPDWIRRFLHE